MLTRDAEEGIDPDTKKEAAPWDNHKGFFEHKLKQPEIYDRGKEDKPHLEQLKMPNFNLQKNEIRALTTMLLGAVDSSMPPSFMYKPADQRHDIQEGWWVIKKYNCQGCHVVDIGQRSIVMDLPRYQSPDWKEQLPPRITSEGARVSPEWLVHFLKNPAMNATMSGDTDRNGVRPYLKIRMPTFYLSDNEIRKLVRYFEAVSYQPQPYIQAKLEPLSTNEQAMARALFTSKEAPCLKCHATGNAAHDKTATAPNFLLAKERLKPGWTGRWLLDPARISPGTSMPSGLFKLAGDHYIFNGTTPPVMSGYPRDHAQLLVRYMLQLTPDEQRRLGGGGAGGGGAGAGEPSEKPLYELETESRHRLDDVGAGDCGLLEEGSREGRRGRGDAADGETTAAAGPAVAVDLASGATITGRKSNSPERSRSAEDSNGRGTVLRAHPWRRCSVAGSYRQRQRHAALRAGGT